MTLRNQSDHLGIRHAANIVSEILAELKHRAKAGVTTKELDDYAASLFKKYKAESAPQLCYKFPGYTCISVNQVAAHGIPSHHVILEEGDLINIDVSAKVNGYFADTGHSFQIPPFTEEIQDLCNSTYEALMGAVEFIESGTPLKKIGAHFENFAHQKGYHIIKNLCSHGVGKSLHEYPNEILPFYSSKEKRVLGTNMVITLEPFLAEDDNFVIEGKDGWSLSTEHGSFAAQHEHTMIVGEDKCIPITQLPF